MLCYQWGISGTLRRENCQAAPERHFLAAGAEQFFSYIYLTALAQTVGIPKSTAHNLLKTLQLYDFVRQDAETKRYQLGPRVHELGFLFSQGSDLIPKAAPFLRKLAEQTLETVKLGVLSKGEMLVVFAIESPHQLHTRGDCGRR